MIRKFLPLLALPLCFIVCSCNPTSKTISKIKKDKMAKLGIDPFEPPRFYQKAQDRVGPDAELGKRIVDKMNTEWMQGPEVRKITPVWVTRQTQNLLPALKNEETDMILAMGITDTLKQEVDFSKPYYKSELVLIINPIANPNLRLNTIGSGHHIGIRTGTAAEEIVKNRYKVQLVPFESLDEAVLALKRGEVTGVIDDKYMAAYSLDTVPGLSQLEITPGTAGTVDVAVGARKGEEALLKLVNDVLTEMGGEYNRLLAEHDGGRVKTVEKRFIDRIRKIKDAEAPRSVTIRVSKEPGARIDIYRFANLSFTLTSTGSGKSYSTSRIDFAGKVGSCSVSCPPGGYVLSLPKFNFRASTAISTTAPGSVTINIRFNANGSVLVS